MIINDARLLVDNTPAHSTQGVVEDLKIEALKFCLQQPQCQVRAAGWYSGKFDDELCLVLWLDDQRIRDMEALDRGPNLILLSIKKCEDWKRCTPSTVARLMKLVQRFEEAGSLKDRVRSGRPSLRIISRRCKLTWPHRSPDLTPVNFWQ
ncbi:hypothetical protein TNCV_1587341 [Trichonephila clavipes]|uniref:Uncharacterized protein n=1 Tax=Trichonephila clavipes TaxID=2585209 RepID=A0A8X6UUV3_TRICX|nr:hypothetical protein TNCV_1587341 [Trichonephila clavipes]